MPTNSDLKTNFDSQYQLGDPEMDTTHKAFIELCTKTEAASGAEFQSLFSELFEHTKTHFADEEARMQASNFSAYGEHRADHQRILGDMERFNQRVQAGRLPMAKAWLGDSLPAWFDLHSKTMDSALAAHIKQSE
ncbi:MAG: hemerythrin HHE cation-binding protein [Oceanospirillaceae bacterium]|nr:hemerythrin HHE cation-binding protein [Oceanospirillaceae bacterium]